MLTGGSAEGEDILQQAFLLAFDRLADQEQVNEATARVRLFRIRQTLKTCLESSLPEGGHP